MHRDDIAVEQSEQGVREIDRRTIAKGVAWTVPVVIVATAAPAAAASGSATPVSATATRNQKTVYVSVVFSNVVGVNSAKIDFITGTKWATVSTTPQELKSTTTSATLTFTLSRQSADSPGQQTVTVSVNGATTDLSVTVP